MFAFRAASISKFVLWIIDPQDWCPVVPSRKITMAAWLWRLAACLLIVSVVVAQEFDDDDNDEKVQSAFSAGAA